MQRLARWVRHMRKLLLGLLMHLSAVPVMGWFTVRLAEMIVGPYKDRRVLALVTPRPYISSHAQIKCPSLRLGRNCFIDERVTIYAHHDGGEVRFSVSIGLAVANDEDQDVEDTLRRADGALYRAKKMGRNRVEMALRSANLQHAAD